MLLKNKNKYKNRKVLFDGIKFDSKKEADRYKVLKKREDQGEIEGIRRQVKFTLIPTQREPDTTGPRGGYKKGKVIEKECYYVADFFYFDLLKQKFVVEDTKGFRTKDYIIKRKLMLWIHNIRIEEV